MIKKLLAATFTCTLSSIVVADPVEMMLSDRLDGNLDQYCLDISGSKENANLEKGLQTHTCYGYQGEIGIDQMFDSEALADNVLLMPEFNVCATLSGFDAGATVGLASCDGSEAQSIALTDNGQLSPIAAPDMCLTAGKDTRLGRGGTSEHQIKALSLKLCSDEQSGFQRWETRS